MRRWTLIILSGGVIGLGGGVAWRAYAMTSQTELERQIPWMETPDLTRTDLPFSGKHFETISWIFNDIGRREVWRTQDREQVLDMLAEWTPTNLTRESMTPSEYEAWDRLRALISILAARAVTGVDMEADVFHAWHAQVKDLLTHPQPYARRTGAGNAGSSGMIYMPDIRALMERMAASDPDDQARTMALVKLAQADGRDPGVVPCPTCPGGVSP
jgi:hypothetical protein